MSSITEQACPRVLVPYSEVDDIHGFQDIFVYLRPETNGVLTESALLNVLRKNRVYAEHAPVVYLANLPGEFLVSRHIIEDHYRCKVEFARRGGALFTQDMIQRFEARFNVPFETAEVLGAYQFIEKTGMAEEELFHVWVDNRNFAVLNGQTIKRLDNVFVVNYDIPALLHKNNGDTNIAVFLLRSTLTPEEFRYMIRDMETSLIDAGVLVRGIPPSHAFHYSKGPFEQVLDALGFLYRPDCSHVPLESLCFSRFLLGRGISKEEILNILENPIRRLRHPDGTETENDIFTFTAGMDYEDAYMSVQWD